MVSRTDSVLREVSPLCYELYIPLGTVPSARKNGRSICGFVDSWVGRGAGAAGLFLPFVPSFPTSRVTRPRKTIDTPFNNRLSTAHSLFLQERIAEQLFDCFAKIVAHLFQDIGYVEGFHVRKHLNQRCIFIFCRQLF